MPAGKTYLGHSENAANATSYTFSTGFGTLTAGQRIIVEIGCRAAGATLNLTVTIGGTVATLPLNVANSDGAGITRSTVAEAVTAALNNNIVVDCNGITGARCGIAVYALTGAAASPFHTAQSIIDGNAASQSASINTPANGVLLGYMNNTGGASWRHSAMSALTTAQTGITLSATEGGGNITWAASPLTLTKDLDAVVESGVSAGDGAMVAISWAEASSGSTGSMAATETGSDTLVGDVDVKVRGSLAATGTGTDVPAVDIDVKVRGSLAATGTGTDTLAGDVDVKVTGSMAVTGTDTDIAAVDIDVKVRGSLAAISTGSDSFVSTGTVRDPSSTGSMAAVETGADSFAGSFDVLISGTMNATGAGVDVFSATGHVPVPVYLGYVDKLQIRKVDRNFGVEIVSNEWLLGIN